jgi:hypothetical protein
MHVLERLIEFGAQMEDVIVEPALPNWLSTFASCADPPIGRNLYSHQYIRDRRAVPGQNSVPMIGQETVAAEGKRDLRPDRCQRLGQQFELGIVKRWNAVFEIARNEEKPGMQFEAP